MNASGWWTLIVWCVIGGVGTGWCIVTIVGAILLRRHYREERRAR